MKNFNTTLKDILNFAGEFNVFNLQTNKLIYSDHNQIQIVGIKNIAKLLCLGFFGKEKPFFSNIKASISNEPEQLQTALLLPGDFTSKTVEATYFFTTIEKNIYKDQTIICNGIFTDPPPSNMLTESGISTSEPFYHFGLYLSSMEDIEEYLFAYKYIEKGVIYPKNFGIKIQWKIKFL